MRLLEAETCTLIDFFESDIPRYAILSHRWEEEEVLFKDFEKSNFRLKKGFRKIQYACTQALRDGLSYVWVDTCGIDKSSSAELSEAINSMFNWYKNAEVCYAYLCDIHDDIGLDTVKLVASVWFTRGWTLQELIAPCDVQFYNADWMWIASRNNLCMELSKHLQIDAIILGQKPSDTVSRMQLRFDQNSRYRGSKPEHTNDSRIARIRGCSVASRMSWASHRRTSRVEDIAYCLLGIFDVNMPLLYGEGEKAFQRLQREIIPATNDLSILAWNPAERVPRHRSLEHLPLLAPSPAYFKGCNTVVCSNEVESVRSHPVTLQMRGSTLHIVNARIVATDAELQSLICRLSLQCQFLEHRTQILGLQIEQFRLFAQISSHVESSEIYQRTFASQRESWLDNIDLAELANVYEWPSIILRDLDSASCFTQLTFDIWFRSPDDVRCQGIFRVHPLVFWDNQSGTFNVSEGGEESTYCVGIDLGVHGKFSIVAQGIFSNTLAERGFGVEVYNPDAFPISIDRARNMQHWTNKVQFGHDLFSAPSVAIETAVNELLIVKQCVSKRSNTWCEVYYTSIVDKEGNPSILT